MLILSLLIFLSISSALAAAIFWLMPTRGEQRLRAANAPARESNWTETVVKIAGPLSKLSAPQGDWETSPLRLRFFNAGIRGNSAQLIFYGAKTVLPLGLAALGFFWLRVTSHSFGLTLFFYLTLFALIGVYLPNFALWMAVRRRKREIFENFPDAADLMLVCIEAGLGLDAALTKVTEEVRRKSIALAEELHLTNLEMRAGASRDKALRNLALRTGVEEIGTFCSMLTQADKFGTSIGDSLRVFSEDLRYKRQMHAEELAAKIPTKMLFPLVLFIFPSVIMVILGPAIIRIIRTIAPMLSGRG
jgi:tight adherence protein C